MLKWFNERYAHLDASKINATDVAPKLAIDDHVALLRLLDSKLDDPAPDQKVTLWPKHDKVGDQLNPTKKRKSEHAKTKHRTKRVKTNDSSKSGARASGSFKASGSAGVAVQTQGGKTQRRVGSSRLRSKVTR